MKVDCAIIGGGIVGLSVGLHLLRQQPGLRLLVLEKEAAVARHQTGHNSGVIHSGIYYRPGSLKAQFAREGNLSIIQFCRRYGIAHDVCGKFIVATRGNELSRLESLYRRGLSNGLSVNRLTQDEVQEIEPHVRCLAGLQVPSTGRADFRAVSLKIAALIQEAGGEIRTMSHVSAVLSRGEAHILVVPGAEVEARFLINCGGLYSDRIARQAGCSLTTRIIPFRGEYYDLVPERRHLIKTLVYPVPDPSFPFLGVHFTRMIEGTVHAGPNAVLALSREGYRKSDLRLNDLYETLTFPGFWRMARRHYRTGLKEIERSIRKSCFVKSLQALVPEVTEDDFVPSASGVRAQAVHLTGELVDDFLIVRGTNSLHVCNAPSPAATASLEIGRYVATQLPDLRQVTRVAMAASAANVS